MDFALEKKRVQLLIFIAGVIALSIAAEKCREMVGEEAASKSGKFTWLNCFDMGSGTLACSVKEGVKLYCYNLKTAHVELARMQAIESALVDAVSQGLPPKDAAKQAQKEGKKAAKLVSRQAKQVIGPIISSGWDFFEAMYFGGSMAEGFLRGSGTLVGAYGGGFLGEQRFGRFGYLVGSHLGSWAGGRIGLMMYDVVNGLNFLLQIVQTGGGDASDAETSYEAQTERSKAYAETYETAVESSEVYMESTNSEEL